jgi:hypothetical protein
MYAALAVTLNGLKRWMESQGDFSDNERRASSESLCGVAGGDIAGSRRVAPAVVYKSKYETECE